MTTRKQSPRRILTAQRRKQRGQDILRRPQQLGRRGIEFWWYIVKNVNDSILWSNQHWDNASRSGTMTLQGSLAEGRRLTKHLVVDVVYEGNYWLISEPMFSMHASGSTISKAINAFRRIFLQYLDTLDEHENTSSMSQHLHDQLLYLRSMIIKEQ